MALSFLEKEIKAAQEIKERDMNRFSERLLEEFKRDTLSCLGKPLVEALEIEFNVERYLTARGEFFYGGFEHRLTRYRGNTGCTWNVLEWSEETGSRETTLSRVPGSIFRRDLLLYLGDLKKEQMHESS